jgi:hypothetical protein
MGVNFGICSPRTSTARAGGAVEVRAASPGRRGFDDRGICMDRDASVEIERQRTGITR